MEAKLEAERRDDNGKGVARKLRAAGRVPAVFYGHGQETVPLSVDAREMFHLLHTAGGSNVLLDLVVDGKPHLAMPREIQRDHIHNTLIHVDFLAVSRTEKIAVDVPVIEVGDAAGVKEGGVVEHHLRDLHIESLPQDVPEHIEVDITDLNIGDMIHVRDVVVPEGVTILTEPRRCGPVGHHARGAPRRGRARAPRRRGPRGRGGAPRRGRGSTRRGGRGRSRCRGGRRELVHGSSGSSPAWATPAIDTPGPVTTPAPWSPTCWRAQAGERFRKARFVPVETAEIAIDGRKAWLAKSLRFMNESGPSYASIAKKHDVTPDHVIAVHDEIDLPFGALKVKIGGSTAGHNGLKSLQQSLRTPDFLRVRVGVGRPPGRQDPADYVLQPFAKREEADVAILIDAAADAVRSLILDGLAATQDKHNRSGARD